MLEILNNKEMNYNKCNVFKLIITNVKIRGNKPVIRHQEWSCRCISCVNRGLILTVQQNASLLKFLQPDLSLLWKRLEPQLCGERFQHGPRRTGAWRSASEIHSRRFATVQSLPMSLLTRAPGVRKRRNFRLLPAWSRSSRIGLNRSAADAATLAVIEVA